MALYASDIETSGFLEQMKLQAKPRLHNICNIAIDSDEVILIEGSDKKAVQSWLDQGHTLIIHYGKLFDGEALKLLGYDISKIKIIDSLALSWYLDTKRIKHGLEDYGVEFGVPKPPITDWENLSQEEYNHRVTEDCRIQKRVWLKLVGRLKELYGTAPGAYDHVIAYMMQKMEELRQQQENKWKLDVEAAEKLKDQLAKEIEDKTVALIEVMPKNPIYAVRKRPAKPFLKSGELSSHGVKWKELTDSLGLPFEHKDDIKVVVEYVEGNPASHVQMKAWLDSLSWSPLTFKFVKEDDGTMRQIPQINLKGGEICDSVKELIPKCPGIEHIAGLGILNHRYGVVKGFLRDAIDGELIASAQGFTNTLRNQHREIVNLPSLRVKYGKELRGLLLADEGMKLLGSDLSSLEDRLKHHFQWKLDPEYVKSQMTKGFDPHNAIAVSAGLMTQDDADFYAKYKEVDGEGFSSEDKAKFKRLDEIRATGKATNYACQYGSGVKTLARTAKVSEKVAKKLHEGYHKLNWSIAKISSMMTVKKTSFGDWQYNPISKMWYSLRSDKDRFSTLIQGTGSYILDLWLYHTQKLCEQRDLDFLLIGQFHDELILRLPESLQDVYREVVADGLAKVNNQLKLNRDLACDIKFGDRYSDIH